MTQPKFLDLVQRLETHQAAGEWPAMLLEISNLVIAMVNDPRARGVVFGSAEMDRFCQAAGAMSARQLSLAAPDGYNDQLAIHLVTEVYEAQGGHTLALKDVIRARPDLTHLVIVTNLHDRQLPLESFNRDMAKPVQIVAAPSLSLPDKLRWLQLQLASLKPGLLTLFNHHYDVAAIGAAQPGAARETVYFHHCDHDMALGVFLPHALHVDCTHLSHYQCRHHLGVGRQAYWPLVAPDQGARGGHRFMAGGDLVTCAHGSANKFLAPGRYGYFDVLFRRLTEVGGSHIHVGTLPPEQLAGFRARLDAAGVDPARFRHQTPVPSLWGWLRDSGVDLCLSSFPVQGAKGIVETMGAGIPVLVQQSTFARLHSTRDIAYPEALWWETPDDLVRVLSGVTPAVLAEQAEASRRYYDTWHHPRELAYAVNNARLTAPVPPVRSVPCDTLALFLR